MGRWLPDDQDREDTYLPSPEEIAAACAAFQSRWTAAERESRRVGPRADDLRRRVVDPSVERVARLYLTARQRVTQRRSG
jgi:hypothetical protein